MSKQNISHQGQTVFEGLDLQGISFNHEKLRNLKDASFRNCNLGRADFSSCILENVDLSGCNLQDTNFCGATLTGAFIQDIKINEEANFEGAICKFIKETQTIGRTPKIVEFSTEDKLYTYLNYRTDNPQDIERIQKLKEKTQDIKQEFLRIHLIRDPIQKKLELQYLAERSPQDDNGEMHLIEPEQYYEMFKSYEMQQWMEARKQSWWQRILWFQIEPWVEQANQWTQELDIFPLLENLGRLSLLVAVVTFINSILRAPDVEINFSEVDPINRFNLEQLRTSRNGLVGLDASTASPTNITTQSQEVSADNSDVEAIVDLSKINLSTANLTDANLSGVNLTKADLRAATLTRANLSRAMLKDANLNHIYSRRDNISRSENSEEHLLSHVSGLIPPVLKRGADLRQADLSEAVLENAKLDRADLRQADLSEAVLENAKLERADLFEANLSRANLTNADLANANLTNADLANANLTNADLANADLSDAKLSEADLFNANLPGVDLSGADLSNANLRGANLFCAENPEKASFQDAKGVSDDVIGYLNQQDTDLAGKDFSGVSLQCLDLSEANLSGINLSEANLSNVDLSNVDLSNANLQGANLFCAKNADSASFQDVEGVSDDVISYITKQDTSLAKKDFSGANLQCLDLWQADLSGTDLSGTDLSEISLWDANLSGADLSGADLSGTYLWRTDLSDADLSDADLSDADLSDAHFCQTTMPDRTINNEDCREE